MRRLTATFAAPLGLLVGCGAPAHDPPRHIVAVESPRDDFHASMATLDQVRDRAARRGTRPRSLAVSGDTWAALARCESGMRNDGGAPYYGYFQFSAGTWRSLGYSGLPTDVDYAVQRAAAERLVARSGWGQFPHCARRLGLR